jgi:SAM-dependent methyltransferase
VKHDIEGFKAGRAQLLPFEVAEFGPLEGRLLHLQCQLGLDTLDIARLHPTVEVMGLDPSEAAIKQATRLAAELKLDQRAEFAVADAERFPAVVGQRTFDVVYAGKGALSGVPDLDEWAEAVRKLLKPDGFLYISEYHPVVEVLSDDEPVPALDYFHTGPCIAEEGYTWIQPVARVLSALIRARFHLQFFHEWDYADQPIRPWLVQGPDHRWRWPGGNGSLPLMYSVKALLPEPEPGR